MSAPPAAGGTRTRVDAWSGIGLLGLASVATLLAIPLALDARGPGATWKALVAGFALLGVGGAVVTAVGAALLARREGVAASELAHLFGATLRQPPGWALPLLGAILTIPALALYSPTLVESDSGRLAASILHVQRHGIEYLVDTQEVFLPHIVLGPVLALGGIRAVQLVDALSVVALGAVTASLAWRITRSTAAVAGAVLALTSLTAVADRVFRIPMYPAMLAFGFLGVYLAHRALVASAPAERRRSAVLAGLCLVISFEAHQVGQLFLVLTAFLVVTAPPRRVLPGLGPVYLAAAVFSIPRMILNASEGGLSHFLSNRVDFWVTEGYLLEIQTKFFDYPRDLSYSEYLSRLPAGLQEAWNWPGLTALGLGTLALLTVHGPVRRFALVSTVFLLTVIVAFRLPFVGRYFSLLHVGMALAVAVLLAFWSRRYSWGARATAAAVVVLAGMSAWSYHLNANLVQELAHRVATEPYAAFAAQIPRDDGVLGTRSMYLNFASTGPSAYGDQFLTESEVVTYLTWPSDEAVIRVMRRHGLHWVYVPRVPRRLVSKYNNVWLVPAYGRAARYHLMVGDSPNFCLAGAQRGRRLYKLDPGGSRLVTGRARRCPMTNGG